MTAMASAMMTSAIGNPLIRNEPRVAPLSQGATDPPGEDRISSATPSQTKSIASVTTMSGTRVSTMSAPLISPMARPTPSTIIRAGTPAMRSIRTAAVTAQTAIMEATDRSMPPTMTTTAMAAVAKAKGRAERARLSSPGAPKLGWISLVSASSSASRTARPMTQACLRISAVMRRPLPRSGHRRRA